METLATHIEHGRAGQVGDDRLGLDHEPGHNGWWELGLGCKRCLFGIPLQNFWGWWLTIFSTFALYMWLFGKGAKPTQAGFDLLVPGSHLVTGLSIVIISLLTGAGGLVLIGLFAMLPWAIAGWLKIT